MAALYDKKYKSLEYINLIIFSTGLHSLPYSALSILSRTLDSRQS